MDGTALRGAPRGPCRIETRFGPFAWCRFEDPGSGRPALAILRGDVRGQEPLLARVHSSCVTSEVFGARDCDCAEQLADSFAKIAEAGRGVLFYLMQEGRGAGLAAKARDRMMVQASGERLTTFQAYARLGLPRDARRYDAVEDMCRRLRICAPLRVLTNNPEKVAGLARAGVRLAGTLGLRRPPSPYSLRYLAAKRGAGHALGADAPEVRAAALPERVRFIEPAPVPDAPRFWHVASYLLPVAPPGAVCEPPRWLHARVYVDREHGRERVVLAHGIGAAVTPLRRVQRHRLEDRLPLARASASARRWRSDFEAMAARGAGRALFLDADERATPDAATRGLLRHEPAAG